MALSLSRLSLACLLNRYPSDRSASPFPRTRYALTFLQVISELQKQARPAVRWTVVDLMPEQVEPFANCGRASTQSSGIAAPECEFHSVRASQASAHGQTVSRCPAALIEAEGYHGPVTVTSRALASSPLAPCPSVSSYIAAFSAPSLVCADVDFLFCLIGRERDPTACDLRRCEGRLCSHAATQPCPIQRLPSIAEP